MQISTKETSPAKDSMIQQIQEDLDYDQGLKEFLRDDDDQDEIAACNEEIETKDQHQFLSSLAEFIKFNDEHLGEAVPEITVDEFQNALQKAKWRQEQDMLQTMLELKTLVENS